jgi:hypothetical protein
VETQDYTESCASITDLSITLPLFSTTQYRTRSEVTSKPTFTRRARKGPQMTMKLDNLLGQIISQQISVIMRFIFFTLL